MRDGIPRQPSTLLNDDSSEQEQRDWREGPGNEDQLAVFDLLPKGSLTHVCARPARPAGA
jgi:hypothetical protein